MLLGQAESGARLIIFPLEPSRTNNRQSGKSTLRKQFQLLYASKDEFEASKKADQKARSIFDNLVADLSTQGRVAIGFLTHQTSGCAASIAASFIPTVERESLDMQHPATADWNRVRRTNTRTADAVRSCYGSAACWRGLCTRTSWRTSHDCGRKCRTTSRLRPGWSIERRMSVDSSPMPPRRPRRLSPPIKSTRS